ncbi:MAG: hypothetical protein R2695_02315 [Acidimicrobiales bacterium]
MLAVLTAVIVLPTIGHIPVAMAQVDPGELSALEERRDDLERELRGWMPISRRSTPRSAGIKREIRRGLVETELLADDIEQAAFDRQEPASTQVRMAIIGFTRGDPRQNALLNEVLTLEGDDEPARRRELYEAVIENAVARLSVIDERLDTLHERL